MEIRQPRDQFSGSLEIKFSPDFAKKYSERIHRIQMFIDSECIRLMAPYTPMNTGTLMRSATSGTVIGSGVIHQNTPYARYLYYGVIYGPNIPLYENGELVGFWSPSKKDSTGRPITYSTAKHPLAGKMWFERMKADHKDDILRGAQAIAEENK